MNKKYRILVIGISGNVSLSIVKVLKNIQFCELEIFGASIYRDIAGFSFVDFALICPTVYDKNFHGWLIGVIDKYGIDLVISGVEEVIRALVDFKNQPKDCIYLVPESKNIAIFNDKLRTMNWLEENSIDSPRTIDLDRENSFDLLRDTLGFPLLVKPKIGKGSQNCKILIAKDELIPYIDTGGYIAQEYIGSEQNEFTCGVYKSKFGYTKVIVMRRLLKGGSTVYAEVSKNKIIEDYCHRIAVKIDTNCPFNIQLRLSSSGKPYCFEINMRLSGTTAIRHHFGFRDLEAWLKESLLNLDSRNLFKINQGVAIRYEDEVYFDKNFLDSICSNSAIPVEGLKNL